MSYPTAGAGWEVVFADADGDYGDDKGQDGGDDADPEGGGEAGRQGVVIDGAAGLRLSRRRWRRRSVLTREQFAQAFDQQHFIGRVGCDVEDFPATSGSTNELD